MDPDIPLDVNVFAATPPPSNPWPPFSFPADSPNSMNLTLRRNVTWRSEIPDYQYERFALLLVASLFGFVAVLGTVGNLLVILVVACNRQMRSTTNLLIIRLVDVCRSNCAFLIKIML